MFPNFLRFFLKVFATREATGIYHLLHQQPRSASLGAKEKFGNLFITSFDKILYNTMSFQYFPDISYFCKFLSLARQRVYCKPILILKTKLRFTCAERKTWLFFAYIDKVFIFEGRLGNGL